MVEGLLQIESERTSLSRIEAIKLLNKIQVEDLKKWEGKYHKRAKFCLERNFLLAIVENEGIRYSKVLNL